MDGLAMLFAMGLSALLGILSLFAILRIFSIDSTLKQILLEMRQNRK